jgi:hypothetical protein
VEDRSFFLSKAIDKGVQLGWLIEYCIPEMDSYRSIVGNDAQFPVASHMARHVINLPLTCNQKAARKVMNTVRKIASHA